MTIGIIIGAGGGTGTTLNLKSDLMRANGKKVQFTCSEETPVVITFPDSTVSTFTSITDLDLSSSSANTYNITIQKSGQVSLNGSSEQATLGTVILTADGITNITNNYQVELINSLEEVTVHTESSAKDIDYDETGKLNLGPFNFSKINWSDNKTVIANTISTYTKDGVFFANSIAEVTYTDGGIAIDIPTNIIPVKAGDSIKSTVAGKIYFYY